MKQRLRIVVLYPLLTAAQGDEGNARVLAHRAALRGIACDTRTHHRGHVPDADIYLLGGVEQQTMAMLAALLHEADFTNRVHSLGAVVLAVNAGYQVLGRSFQTPDGAIHDGIGLLDVISVREPREVVGPVITLPSAHRGLSAMSGYECHSSRTSLGATATPLAGLELGHGNAGCTPAGGSDPPRPPQDGAVSGRVVGTYLHGPALARNADLADLLLGWACGSQLDPAPADTMNALRHQRIEEDRADPTGWGGRRYASAWGHLRRSRSLRRKDMP